MKGAGAEKNCEKPNDGVCLESEMRKEPVVTKRNRKTASPEHREKQSNLEPIDPKVPDVNRHGGERKEEGSDQKGAGRPIYFFERDS